MVPLKTSIRKSDTSVASPPAGVYDVIVVVRGEESFNSPGAEFSVVAGDTLVLVASHRDMNNAFRFLATDQSA